MSGRQGLSLAVRPRDALSEEVVCNRPRQSVVTTADEGLCLYPAGHLLRGLHGLHNFTTCCVTPFLMHRRTQIQTNTPKRTQTILDVSDCFILFLHVSTNDSRILRLEGCMHHLLLVPELPSPPSLLQPVQEMEQAFIVIQRTNNNKEHVIEASLPCKMCGLTLLHMCIYIYNLLFTYHQYP